MLSLRRSFNKFNGHNNFTEPTVGNNGNELVPFLTVWTELADKFVFCIKIRHLFNFNEYGKYSVCIEKKRIAITYIFNYGKLMLHEIRSLSH